MPNPPVLPSSIGPYTSTTSGNVQTLPAATGSGVTYSVTENDPDGSITSFNSSTRRIVVDIPTNLTTLTITYTATNSGGSVSRSVDFQRLSPLPTLTTPNFSDDTGDDQSWTQNTPISSINVPAASGNPTPSYSLVGLSPSGITFNTSSRIISGTPIFTGSGTIRIRATNSQGSDDWTIGYTTGVTLSTPNFADDTGNDQNWTQNTAITPIIVPAASGNPTPSYSVVSALPTGYII